jgi:hypothetical protein
MPPCSVRNRHAGELLDVYRLAQIAGRLDVSIYWLLRRKAMRWTCLCQNAGPKAPFLGLACRRQNRAADLAEQKVHLKPRFFDILELRLRERAVAAHAVVRQLPVAGCIGDQFAAPRLDCSKSPAQPTLPANLCHARGKRVVAAGVEDHKAQLPGLARL